LHVFEKIEEEIERLREKDIEKTLYMPNDHQSQVKLFF